VSAEDKKTAGDPSSEPSEREKRLWDRHVMDRPNPRILDDMEVLERMALLRAAGKITPRTAALASVIFQTGGVRVKSFALDYDTVLDYAVELKDAAVNEKEQESLREVSEEAKELYGDRPSALQYATFLLGDARLLQKTFTDAEDVEECLRRLARWHGWVATVEKSSSCGFDRYAEALHKGIPPLVKREGKLQVCFGGSQAGGRNYLVLCDPENIPLEKGAPMVATKSARKAARTNPDVRHALARQRHGLKDKPTDFIVSVTKPLVRGMSLEEFQKGRYTAYFIYNWRPSAAGWREEIIEIVGEPKDNKD
jgi:hypothetical protein